MLTKFLDQSAALTAGAVSVLSDQVTKMKIRMHLMNPKDEITDQDLENMKTEMSSAEHDNDASAGNLSPVF